MQHALEVAHRDLQTHERLELIISCHRDFNDYLRQVAEEGGMDWGIELDINTLPRVK